MRFVRALLFTPVLVLILPVLLVLVFILLIAESDAGPLRLLLSDEIRAYGFSRGFRRFMQKIFVPTYKYHVQSFVLGAAGILVVTVGLRGLGILPVWIVYGALALEFTLLIVWAITVYFTEEEQTTENGKVLTHKVPPPQNSEHLASAIRELSSHIALLENRLKTTEGRFEQLGRLDGSVRELATKMNEIVNDQLTLRVRREFEQLLTEMSQRIAESKDQPQ
jgi:hypothetical protein